MVIPNSVMAKVRVTNHYPASRGHVSTISLELDGKVDPNTIIPVLTAAARLSGQVRSQPPPEAVVRRFGDAGTIYELYFTIDDFARSVRIESEVLTNLWMSLERAGIRGAVPKQNIALLASGIPPKS
jgi:small-conductance mechanosensitive channel